MENLFPVKTRYRDVPLGELISEEPTIAPSAQLVTSIRRLGVISPLLVNEKMRVIAGRRRLSAARKAEVATVPCRIFPSDWCDADILALVENLQRKDNPVNELHHLDALVANGKSFDQIKTETGMTTQKLNRLLAIRNNLLKNLRRAFEDNIITVRVAELCAKKPQNVQQRLFDLLEENGELKMRDVVASNRVVRATAVASLPSDLFGGNKGRLKELLKEAQEVAETTGQSATANGIKQLLKGI